MLHHSLALLGHKTLRRTSWDEVDNVEVVTAVLFEFNGAHSHQESVSTALTSSLRQCANRRPAFRCNALKSTRLKIFYTIRRGGLREGVHHKAPPLLLRSVG
mmetsp:Transcript_55740/g.167047  ORF Transcript_55740/g.167047 Transcript_55740/m.167047 type:complete len:102 (-) Transcript_55740:1129-1434(-)